MTRPFVAAPGTCAPERRTSRRTLGIVSILAGVIGWFASFELLTEYIRTLQQPDYVPNCNVSLLVTCGPNMGSWQGSVLGFSNTIIGVAAFVVPILVGVLLLAGASLPRWFWRGYAVGLLGGLVLVTWLQYQSFYGLGTLCPWCMVVWAAMIPLFWTSLLAIGSEDQGGLVSSTRITAALRAAYSWTVVIVITHVAVVALVAQLALDWLAEFRR